MYSLQFESHYEIILTNPSNRNDSLFGVEFVLLQSEWMVSIDMYQSPFSVCLLVLKKKKFLSRSLWIKNLKKTKEYIDWNSVLTI